MISVDSFKSDELRASLFPDGNLDQELACDFFRGLFEPYMQSVNGLPLAEQIMSDWDLFADNDTAKRVIDEALSWSDLADINLHADTLVVYSQNVSESLREWTKLKESIKYSSRFLSDLSPLENLGLRDSLLNSEEVLNSFGNKCFYRARIAKEKDVKFTTKDLGMPSVDKTLAGRANVEGIPYLYLCTEPETCYYEVRAAYLDRVWVGKYQVIDGETVRLVNLIPRHRSQQLSVDSEPLVILRNRILMNAISRDLSTPMRRHDKDSMEYLPTQFICEYIRLVLEFDGIMFQSSLKKEGANIVLFKDDKVTCREVKEFEVTKIDIQTASV